MSLLCLMNKAWYFSLWKLLLHRDHSWCWTWRTTNLRLATCFFKVTQLLLDSLIIFSTLVRLVILLDDVMLLHVCLWMMVLRVLVLRVRVLSAPCQIGCRRICHSIPTASWGDAHMTWLWNVCFCCLNLILLLLSSIMLLWMLLLVVVLLLMLIVLLLLGLRRRVHL